MTSCPICERGTPEHVVLDLPDAWISMPKLAPVRGYLVVVAKRHVEEPFQLPEPERSAFWEAVDGVAKAVDEALRPDKLNYEIHGNTLPHLHLHLFPRWSGDRFEGRPIDPREATRRPDPERDELLRAIDGLSRTGSRRPTG